MLDRYIRSCPAMAVTVLLWCATSDGRACSARLVDQSGWQRIGGSIFCMSAPRDLVPADVRSADSEANEWRSGTTSLRYDFSAFADPMDRQVGEGYKSCATRIAGHEARFVTYAHKGKFFAGLYLLIAVTDDGPLGLSLFGASSTETERDELLTALGTVSLGGPCARELQGASSTDAPDPASPHPSVGGAARRN